MFDLSVFGMKPLSTEVMEIMLIVIDAILWLLYNYHRCAAHIVSTFTCCSLHQLVCDVVQSWACQDQPSHHLQTLEKGSGGGVFTGSHHSFGPKNTIKALSCRLSTASSLFSIHLSFFFPFLFLVRWCPLWKSPTVCIQNLNAFCQLAVPAVTVEIHLSADVPSVWHRVASPSILKGLSWPAGTGGR